VLVLITVTRVGLVGLGRLAGLLGGFAVLLGPAGVRRVLVRAPGGLGAGVVLGRARGRCLVVLLLGGGRTLLRRGRGFGRLCGFALRLCGAVVRVRGGVRRGGPSTAVGSVAVHG